MYRSDHSPLAAWLYSNFTMDYLFVPSVIADYLSFLSRPFMRPSCPSLFWPLRPPFLPQESDNHPKQGVDYRIIIRGLFPSNTQLPIWQIRYRTHGVLYIVPCTIGKPLLRSPITTGRAVCPKYPLQEFPIPLHLSLSPSHSDTGLHTGT